MQRGAGAHVLCEPCNNHCGRRLVPEYLVLAKAADDVLRRATGPRTDGRRYLPGTIELAMPGFALGHIARQATAMLLAASGGAAVARLHPDLPRLVTGEGLPEPAGVRLGMALAFDTGRVRLSPPHAVGHEDGVSVFCEVAAPPFRWTLSWAGTRLVPAPGTADVTGWLAVPVETVRDTSIELPTGMVIAPAPGDTRDEAAIRRQAQADE